MHRLKLYYTFAVNKETNYQFSKFRIMVNFQLLLKVLGHLKVIEVLLEEASECDEWLMQTIGLEGIMQLKDEVADYLACNAFNS